MVAGWILKKAYYIGLSESLVKNFGGFGFISSMQQCNDFFFLGKQICLGRVGDDFWCHHPNGDPMGIYWLQGCHIFTQIGTCSSLITSMPSFMQVPRPSLAFRQQP